MEYILHKIPEGFVVTSNEEPFNTDLCLYSNQEIMPFDGGLGEIWNDELCKKVIAQQDQIDFSYLSEEKQKEIGWFDIEKLYKQCFPKLNQSKERESGEKTGFEIGFRLAEEILSDRMCTLGQVKEALFQVFNNNDKECCVAKTIDSKVRRILKSLTQPESWKIIGNWENDKFKITKIL